MSFDAREYSLAAGQPLRLYEFALGALRWRYTSADRDISHADLVYESCAIADDGIRQTGQASADMLVITAPADLAVTQRYRAMPPSAEVALTIYDMHYGDDEPVVTWVGSIAQVQWPQLDRCRISCEPLGTSMQQMGLRMTWQRSCPHSLGDRQCRVDIDAHRVEAQIAALDGATITIATVARGLHIAATTTVPGIDAPGVIPYTIAITNIGNVPLSAVDVALTMPDSTLVAAAGPAGDIDADGVLAPAETWTFTASYEATNDDIAAAVDLVCQVAVTAEEIADPVMATITTLITSEAVEPVVPAPPEMIPIPAIPPQMPGGFVMWLVDGEPERRGVTSITGATLSLMAGTVGLQAGQAVWVYPGCPGTLAVCHDVYGNSDNHGGIPHLPGRSPFDGNPVF